MDDSRITALEEKYASLDEKFNRLQSTLERQWDRIDAHFHEEESVNDVVTKLADTAHTIQIVLAGLPAITEQQFSDKTVPLWADVRRIDKGFDEFKLGAEKEHNNIKSQALFEMKAWISSHLHLTQASVGIICVLAGFIFLTHIHSQEKWVEEVKAHILHDQVTMKKLTTELEILVREHSEERP